MVVADFERARASSCTFSAADEVAIDVAPETTPINPSAWYAFRIDSAEAGDIVVTLRYRHAKHRYMPKVSEDGVTWRVLEAAAITELDGGKRVQLRLRAPAGALYVAAQPLQTLDATYRDLRALAARGLVREEEVGRTSGGRPVLLFHAVPKNAKRTVVLVARQHPPETTGGDAFDAFVARLFGDDPAAVAFRRDTALVMVPALNPDGLAQGHWRGNLAGADLNRDWGPFQHPETKSVAGALIALSARYPIAAVLDFHATRRDVVYANPLVDLAPDDLGEMMLKRLESQAPELRSPISRTQNEGAATLKSWALARFKVGGMTLEFGDETDRDIVRRKSAAAADALVAAGQ